MNLFKDPTCTLVFGTDVVCLKNGDGDGNGGITLILVSSVDSTKLDKAPRLSIRIVIWILLSDTIFVNSKKISANTETAMLSRFL